MSEFQISVLSDEDWLDYKSIRLESLRESPDSFGSTFEREAEFVAEHWKSRLRISPTMHDAVALAASADQSYIGLLSCIIPESNTKNAHLFQMWVSPKHRGKGIGTALINRVKNWAAVRGVEKLLLSVTTINSDAISLYQTIGFYPVGDTEALREGSSLKSQTMEIKLVANDA